MAITLNLRVVLSFASKTAQSQQQVSTNRE
jgi:hypothetical protein